MNKETTRKLIEARREKGYTQKDMAFRLGITESYYCRLERGSRKTKIDMALKICAILDKTPNDIYMSEDFPVRKVSSSITD